MKRICALLVAIFAVANCNLESASQWQFLGPSGGSITRVLFDPQPNIAYAQGQYFFRSNNSGLTWKRLPIQGESRIHPLTGKLMLFDTQVLYFSVDHGNSWEKIQPNLAGGPKDYEFHSQKDHYIYAGTGKGIFVTTNGGLNWTESAPRGLCASLAVSPSNGNIVYAFGKRGTIIRTINGGKSWSEQGNVPDNYFYCSMNIDPKNPDIVYIAGINKIFKTTDGGRSWASFPCGCDAQNIVINSRNVLELFAQGQSNVWHSNNGGKNWTNILSRKSPQLPGAFIERFDSISFNPKKNQLFLGVFPQGLLQSTDFGTNWRSSNRGLSNLNIGNVEASFNRTAEFYASGLESPRLFYRSSDKGGTWRLNKSNPRIKSSTLVMSPSNPLVLASHNRKVIHITTDGGLTWQTQQTPFITDSQLAFHPQNPGIIFLSGASYAGSAGFVGVGFARSDDFGKTWTLMNQGLSDKAIWALTVDPHDGNRILVTTFQGMFESRNMGQQWSLIGGELPRDPPNALEFDSLDSNLVYASLHYEGVFRSNDGGRTWIKKSDTIPSSYYTTVFTDPVISKKVYALIFDRIYVSTDAGDSWKLLAKPLPDFVTDISFTPDLILTATRIGVFSRPRP
jgi:photosystem II stability/assembly factor-like uncharacterized protein